MESKSEASLDCLTSHHRKSTIGTTIAFILDACSSANIRVACSLVSS